MERIEIKIEALDANKVIIAFANPDYFSDLLGTTAHSWELDMLVVYKQIISNDEDGITTRTISTAELDEAGISLEELHSIALKNTARMFPAIISDFFGMKILTNSIGSYGASAVLYSNLVKELADRINDDLYIIPSSIHELILLPAKDFIEADFAEVIRGANETIVEPKEVLSNHPYIYSRAEKIVKAI